jgi:hypothetical protein
MNLGETPYERVKRLQANEGRRTKVLDDICVLKVFQ